MKNLLEVRIKIFIFLMRYFNPLAQKIFIFHLSPWWENLPPLLSKYISPIPPWWRISSSCLKIFMFHLPPWWENIILLSHIIYISSTPDERISSPRFHLPPNKRISSSCLKAFLFHQSPDERIPSSGFNIHLIVCLTLGDTFICSIKKVPFTYSLIRRSLLSPMPYANARINFS